MKKCLTSLLIALCMAVCFMPTVVFADGGDVEINETNFPDAAFRQFAAGFDANGDGMLSAAETANVTVIRCSDAVSGDARIADLTGGADLMTGASVELNHLLLVPRNDGRGITAVTDIWVMVRGEYNVN